MRAVPSGACLLARIRHNPGLRSLGVGGPIDPKQFFDGKMSVFLGGREVLVSQEFLNAAKIGSVVEQVCGEGMTEKMRMDVQQQRAFFHVLLEIALDGAGGEP